MSRYGRRQPLRWGMGLDLQRANPPVVQGAAGAQFTRNVTDTGASQTDSVALTLGRLRGITDTGVTQTDTVLSAEAFDLHNPFQGTSGNVISTSNSGAGGTADFFDFVTGSPTYGTAHPNSGSTSMSCQTAAGAAACGWDVSIPTTEILYGRVYWYAGAANGATTRIISIAGDATSLLGNISLDTANRLTANIGGFGTTYVMPSAIPTGSMARIEWLATVDRHGNGKLIVRYFSAAGNGKDSLTPDDELIATNTGIPDQRITSAQVGVTAAATANTWFDDFEVASSGWIGPFGGAQAFEADLTDNGVIQSDAVVRAVVRKVTDTGETQSDTPGRQVVRPTIQDDGVGFGFTDTFTRTVGAGSLGGSWTIAAGSLAFSVDGAEAVATPNAGQQVDAYLDTGAPSHEVRTRVRWDVAPAGSSRNHGVRVRSDATAANSLRIRMSVPAGGSGNVNLAISAVVASSATVIYNLPIVAGNPQAGEWWWIRAAVEGSRLRVWVWRDGTAQPVTPDADLTDTTVPANNLVFLTGQRLAGETSAPTLYWDDYSWRVLDAVVATFQAAGVQTTRNVTDTGDSQSDTVQRQVVRQVVSTGVTQTDSPGRAVSRRVTDTGETQSDTIGRQITRPVTDYGLTKIASDDANRADQGPPPSASWDTDPEGIGAGGFTVTSNQFVPTNAVRNEMSWIADMFGPNVDMSVDVPTLPAATKDLDLEIFSASSWATTLYDGYLAHYTQGTGLSLYRYSGGAPTLLVSTSEALTAGDTYRLRTTPTTVEVWRRSGGAWQQIISVADTTHRNAANRLAIYTTGNAVRLDNFAASSGSILRDAIEPRQVTRAVTSTGVSQSDALTRAVVRGVVSTGETQTDTVVATRGFLRGVTDDGLTKIASDDANRADQGPPPSTSWQTDPEGYGAAGLTVTSNQFAPTAAGDNEMAWLADTFGPDIDMAFDLPVVPPSGQQIDLEILTVWTLSAQAGYDVQYRGDGLITLYRADTGTYNALATATQLLANGDAIRLRVFGSVVEAWVRLAGRWTREIQVSDSTYRSAGVKVGVYTSGSTMRLDNFRASSGSILRDTLTAVPTRVVTDTGVSQADSVSRTAARTRAVTDTGESQSDTLATTRTRPITDTGESQTDTLTRSIVRKVTDTGEAQSDSVVRTRTVPRNVTDTGETQTDTVGRAVVRVIASTGVSQTDSVQASSGGRINISDTGVAQSDAVVRAVTRGVSSTGVTQTDSVVRTRLVTRNVTDTGATMTDTLATARVRVVTDVGEAQTDVLTVTRTRPVTSTGVSQTDTISRAVTRRITDTGESQTDALGGAQSFQRPVTDTGVSQSDAVVRAVVRRVTSTGETQTDVVGRAVARAVSDTGETQSDQLVRRVVRAVSDVGVSQSDSVATTSAGQVAVSDQGVSQTDSLARAVVRRVVDTGEAQSDAPGAVRGAPISDQGVSQSDAVSRRLAAPRAVTDTGESQSDALVGTRQRQVADQGVTQSDALAVAASHPRPVTDQGVSQSDSVDTTAAGVVHLTDIGVAQSDQLRRPSVVRRVVSVGVSQSDTVAPQTALTFHLVDQGVRFFDFVGAVRLHIDQVDSNLTQQAIGSHLSSGGVSSNATQGRVASHASEGIVYSHMAQ